MTQNAQIVKTILFDLDGTIYVDGVLLPGANDLLAKLTDSGISYGFMTNNSSIGPDDYLAKLQKIGVDASMENIITSAEATVLMLEDLMLGPDVYMLATDAFKNYLATKGYRHTDDSPSAVLVGFDPHLSFTDLTVAIKLMMSGVPLVASHPDPACPCAGGCIPDAGAVLAAIKAAINVTPKAIAGKPNRWIVQAAREHFGVKTKEIAIVGDRLMTDIGMAHKYGMRSALVLSGVSCKEDVSQSRFKPSIVINSVADLIDTNWPGKLGWL